MQRNMVDCVIYACHDIGDYSRSNLNTPVVMVGNIHEGFPAIISDDEQGGILAARHLIAKGCQKIAHISGPIDLGLPSDKRTDSFIKACQKLSIPCKVYMTEEGMKKSLDYSGVISRMFYEASDIDGVFASSDIIAAQCIQMAHALGYQIPKDIKIIGYDGVDMGRFLSPQLTTIRQDMPMTVKNVMDTVLALLNEEEVPPLKMVPVALIERKTT